LPGVTPATTRVPYSRQRAAWNEPSRPVIPWTTRRVSRPTRILKREALPSTPRGSWRPPGQADDFLGGVLHPVGSSERQPRLAQHPPPLLHVRSLHADDHRDRQLQVAGGSDDPVGEDVAAEDAPEDVDQHRPDVLVGDEDAEGVLDLSRVGAATHVE